MNSFSQKYLIDKILRDALVEDIGEGDITTNSIIKPGKKLTGRLMAKEKGIIAGINVFAQTFHTIDENVKIDLLKADGDACENLEICAVLTGDSVSMLKAERTALNIIQHLSGIATQTAQFVNIAKKYGVKIADTRKTLPGLRLLQKYAVKTGGGENHRFGLYDHILIKDNHIKAAGGITPAINFARKNAGFTHKIEVEVTNIEETEEALKNRADIIMLDNFTIEKIIEAKKLINCRAMIEISGNVTIDNLEKYCECRPDIISVGYLTHSVKALDFSMKLE